MITFDAKSKVMRNPLIKYHHPSLKMIDLIILMIFGFLVMMFIGVVILIPFFGIHVMEGFSAGADYSDPHNVFILKYFQIVSQFGVFILPAFIFALLVSERPAGYLRIDQKPYWLFLTGGIILIFIILPFLNWLIDLNAAVTFPQALSKLETWFRTIEDEAAELTEAFLATKNFGGFLINLLMVGLFAALGEELIFRGVLIPIFRDWFRSTHLAVIVTSLIFSAFHLQFYGIIPRFVLGLMLGYLFVWSGSLWIPVIIHFVNNGMAVLMSYLAALNIISSNYEDFGSTSSRWLIVGSFILTLLIMMALHRRRIRMT